MPYYEAHPFCMKCKKFSLSFDRLTSTRTLIGDDSTLEKSARSGRAKDSSGIDNLAYERDGANANYDKPKPIKHNKKVGTPTLHFPRPPSTSPSSSNSDSSYYRAKTLAANAVGATGDEDKANALNKRTKRVYDLEEYATVVKKHERKQKRSRNKRKTQNRVGSIDGTVQIHSPLSSFAAAISDEAFDTSGDPDSHFYEHIEAFNPHVARGNYHKNKLLDNRAFCDRTALEGDGDSPTEVYNTEIMRALRRDNRANDSVSVGSFLSMASIRSFPKCNMPQPLSRVLEPLSVTHLDHSDGPDTIRLPRVVETKRKRADKFAQTTIVDESDEAGDLRRSQSDGADPGVIGPVVWEIHKRNMEAQGKEAILKSSSDAY